jgi:hypothetical protein
MMKARLLAVAMSGFADAPLTNTVDLSAKVTKSSQMPRGLLIHNLKARSLNPELLPKLVSSLGEVALAGVEELGEAGNPLQYAKAHRC